MKFIYLIAGLILITMSQINKEHEVFQASCGICLYVLFATTAIKEEIMEYIDKKLKP